MPECRTPELCPLWWAATWDSFSRTATRRPGNRRTNWYAVASPTMPPPTTARSWVMEEYYGAGGRDRRTEPSPLPNSTYSRPAGRARSFRRLHDGLVTG